MLGILLAAAVMIAGTVALLYVRTESLKGGPGARSLELLPAQTLLAASIERLDRLEAELAGLGGNERKLDAILAAYLKEIDGRLSDSLSVRGDTASAVRRATVAAGAALVVVKDGPPAWVTLLCLGNEENAGLALSGAKQSGEVEGIEIYKAKVFAAAFGKVLAFCERKEPLEQMARSLAARGAGSLGTVPAFLEARKGNVRSGRAWFYADGGSPGALAQPAPKDSARSASGIEYLAGSVDLTGRDLVLRARAKLTEAPGDYAKLRLQPAKLTIPEMVPREGTAFVALSLSNLASSYAEILEVLDPWFKGLRGNKLSELIRNFERQGESGPDVKGQIVPVLHGEVGALLSMPDLSLDTLIIPVTNREVARGLALHTFKKLFGADPRPVVENDVHLSLVPSDPPVAYALYEDFLLVSRNPRRLAWAVREIAAKKSIAGDPEFRKAMSSLPGASTLLFAAWDGSAAKEKGQVPGTAIATLSIAMNPSDVTVTASIRGLAEFLTADSFRLSDAGAQARAAAEKADEDPSRRNIKRLAEVFKEYLVKNGRYPGSLGDVDVVTKENSSLLVRPGDSYPVARLGIPPTSYECAFDAVKTHKFLPDTPGGLPMLWEAAAAHNGKRWVVYFDGTARLEAVSVPDLVNRIKTGVEGAANMDPAAQREPAAKPQSGTGAPAQPAETKPALKR